MMQIQCPKCHEWTDCESGKCLFCSASLDRIPEQGSFPNDADSQSDVNWFNRECKGWKYWQLIIAYSVVIALLIGFVFLWLNADKFSSKNKRTISDDDARSRVLLEIEKMNELEKKRTEEESKRIQEENKRIRQQFEDLERQIEQQER